MKTDGKVENIYYTLLYRRGSRHITVRVKADGKVKVSAPYGISKAAVERVIISNKEKLLHTIVKQQQAMHTYESGDTFLYDGTPYTLRLERGIHHGIRLQGPFLVVTYPGQVVDPLSVCHLIKELYREEACKRLAPLISYWAEHLQVPPPPFSVRDSKIRWGSCSAKGRLSFSLRCQALNDTQLSYLVLHEMAHLVHFNHSKEFHSLLLHYMSDYKQVQRSIFSLQQETQL
ncbi:MAG: hypothetical protein PWP59_1898 [Sphaerochaeta sp.]|jgi:predicted metal-dependent hydrolase|nr:hypothetical protein [Sphaerochaeta sp.]